MKRVVGQCSHRDLIDMSVFILKEWEKPENKEKTLSLGGYSSQFNKKQKIAWAVVVSMIKRNYLEAIGGIKEVLVWGDDNHPEGTGFEYKLFNNASFEVKQLLRKLLGGKK